MRSLLCMLPVLLAGCTSTSRPAFLTVWGSGPADVWVGGESSTLLRWNGSVWTKGAPEVPGYGNIAAISGSDPSNVWIVNNQSILSWNGTTLTSLREPIGVSETLVSASGTTGVWGSGVNQVWFTRSAGYVSTWDPAAGRISNSSPCVSRASELVCAPMGPLFGIWGIGEQAWAVGASTDYKSGLVASVTVKGSNPLLTPAQIPLNSIWGSSATDLWAVGAGGIIHGDGTQWQQLYFGDSLKGVWASAPNDVWAVGSSTGNEGLILHFDGQDWSNVAMDLVGPLGSLYAVWGSSASDIWVVGKNATLLHKSGSQWQKIDMTQLVPAKSTPIFIAPG